MYIFLPIIIFSIIGIMVIFVRKMPNVRQMPIYDASAFYDSWLYKFPVKIKSFRFWHVKEASLAFMEKSLRKFKIMLLKFENKLSHLTVKLKRKRGNGERAAVVEKLSVQSNGNGSSRLIEDLSKIFNSIEEDAAGKNEGDSAIIKIKHQEDFNDDSSVRRERGILEEIRINPRNMEAYKKLGFLYFEYKNYEDALNSFQQAIKLGCKDEKILEIIEEINRNL
ncbi:MAG: hypothetical protein US76_02490 [Parcubacteria group bacterium GW2011_GWA2_38_13b]|nr:MAG: hypothetical protein US76_02490 [Parcubacteria group bacterium GW2011_GWA2_38_13b]